MTEQTTVTRAAGDFVRDGFEVGAKVVMKRREAPWYARPIVWFCRLCHWRTRWDVETFTITDVTVTVLEVEASDGGPVSFDCGGGQL